VVQTLTLTLTSGTNQLIPWNDSIKVLLQKKLTFSHDARIYLSFDQT
jgi:hypothetical protein